MHYFSQRNRLSEGKMTLRKMWKKETGHHMQDAKAHQQVHFNESKKEKDCVKNIKRVTFSSGMGFLQLLGRKLAL